MTAPALLMNLGQNIFYEQVGQFLNWIFGANPYSINSSTNGTMSDGLTNWNSGYFDNVTGELKNPVPSDVNYVEKVIFTIPPQDMLLRPLGTDYTGEQFTMKWTGGSGWTMAVSSGASSQSVSGSTLSFTYDGTSNITIRLTVGSGSRTDPPRNIQVYQNRYATNVANGELFNPDWKAQVKQFGVVRLLDLMCANNNQLSDISQFADASFNGMGGLFGFYYGSDYSGPVTNTQYGPKACVHPTVLARLANETGCILHVTLPLHMTDSAVTAFATSMKNNTTIKVQYELSNECWNFGFHQFNECQTSGTAIYGSGDTARGFKYYGYRAAEVMKIIRDVYGDRTRWRGVIATQLAGYGGVTLYNMQGATDYLTTAGLQISDVFEALHVAAYYNGVVLTAGINAVATNTTTYINAPSHPYNTGDYVRIFFSSGSGFSALSGKYQITKVSADQFTIPVDTSSHSAFVNDNRCYAVASGLFDIMDQSATLFAGSPGRYANKYQFFNEQMRSVGLTGSCTSGLWSVGQDSCVSGFIATYFPQQLAIAISKGLVLEMYEAGNTLQGDGNLAGYGGNAQLTEFMINHNRSYEAAEVLQAMFQAFIKCGGQTPAKFELEGTPSQYGTWASINYWPSAANNNAIDTANPTHKMTLLANSRKRRFKIRC